MHEPHDFDRRKFLQSAAVSGAAISIAGRLGRAAESDATPFPLSRLVPEAPFAHTEQVFADDSSLAVDAQAKQVLDGIEARLRRAGASTSTMFKLHWYVANAADVPTIAAVMRRELGGSPLPAVTFVVGNLPQAELRVAADGIAVSRTAVEPGRVVRVEGAAVLPPTHKLYISGDAGRGPLATSVVGTLESLERTLTFCGLDWSQVVQLKTFLQPIAATADVRRRMESFFGRRPLPVLTFVEWSSSAEVPIEIEAIVAVPPELGNRSGDTVEYLTPPGVTASPVFSRAARVRTAASIYVSGLYANADTPDGQVRELLNLLRDTVERDGSDLRHLVKATYYVADEAVSKALGAIRPEFYDPKRPPAASKALVDGSGRPGKSITLDMIAVPKPK